MDHRKSKCSIMIIQNNIIQIYRYRKNKTCKFWKRIYCLWIIYIKLTIQQSSRKKVIKSLRPILRPVKHFICEIKNKIFEKKIDIKVKKRNDGFVFMSTVFVSKLLTFRRIFLSAFPHIAFTAGTRHYIRKTILY